MTLRCDVVVIGAGHNGLVAANYLADQGLEVIVVERAARIGGMSSSDRVIAEAPDHVVNYCATDLAFWPLSPVSVELNLAEHGLRSVPVDPQFAYLHPDGASVALWHDADRTAQEIAYFSPRDARAFTEYIALLDRLLAILRPLMLVNPSRPDRDVRHAYANAFRRLRPLGELLRWLTTSGSDLVEQRFEHDIVRSAMYALAAGYGPINARGTALAHIALAILHHGASSRPVGGMQAVPDALRRRLELIRGRVLTSAEVTQVLIDAGRASGVELRDGRRVEATIGVIATCDPRALFTRMLPPRALPARLERRARRIPTNRSGAAQMSANFALRGQISPQRHQGLRRDDLDLRIPYLLIGTADETARGFDAVTRGNIAAAEDMLLCVSVINGADPTQAPAGQDIVYVYTSSVPLRPPGGWCSAEDEVATRIVERVDSVFPGFAELEIGRHVDSPAGIEARTGASDGSMFHVDLELLRVGPLRPALGLGNFRLPVKGLFLGGAGAHPTGAVTGLPGRLAARELMRTHQLSARRGGEPAPAP